MIKVSYKIPVKAIFRHNAIFSLSKLDELVISYMVNGIRYKSASICIEGDLTNPRGTRRFNDKLMLKGHPRFKYTKSHVLSIDLITSLC